MDFERIAAKQNLQKRIEKNKAFKNSISIKAAPSEKGNDARRSF